MICPFCGSDLALVGHLDLISPPTPAPDVVTPFDDSAFTYSGSGWNIYVAPVPDATKFGAGDHWTDVSGSSYGFIFSGTRVQLIGSRSPWLGIAAVALDGAAPVDVDLYGSPSLNQQITYDSGPIAAGTHHITVTNTGRKNPAASGTRISADRADITNGAIIAPLLPPPTPTPARAIQVQGNKLVNAAGQTVILRGVGQMGMEYSCVQVGRLSGDVPLTQATVDGLKTWRGLNTVRLPLNEHCWLGVEGTPGGEAYRAGVEAYVNLLCAAGLYVILDLHWSAQAGQSASGQQPMPNIDYSRDFWTSVANRFKANDRVLFDLFNEPIPNDGPSDATDDAARRSWECWLNGGLACNAVMTAGAGPSINNVQTVGMQALLDAVRATGATNVCVIGGILWGQALWSSSARNILTYLPKDPLGQLVASSHVYPVYPSSCVDATCFDREYAPVLAQMPVVVGELGSTFAQAAQLQAEMAWMDAHGVGYLAWVWNRASDRALLLDYTGAPTDYGRVFKDHLAAITP